MLPAMLLVILICAAGGQLCDRIAQPVDNCSNSALVAQIILAKTGLYDGSQQLKISCGKIRP
jgi:hypothetical protein